MPKTSFFIFGILISAFGPYIYGGLRLDSFYIYTLFIMQFITFSFLRINIIKNKFVFLIWLSFALIFLSVLIPSVFYNKLSFSYLADIESYILPLVLIFVVSTIVVTMSEIEINQLITKISVIYIGLLSINTLLILIDLYFIDMDFLSAFHGSYSTGQLSVSEKAGSMGRLSGIFNQPIESGISYSIGLFAIHFLSKTKSIQKNYIVLLTLIILGGLFSVSKTFVFVGLPIYLLFNMKNFLLVFWKIKFLTAALILFGVSIKLLSNWDGKDFLLRFFFNDSTDQLSLFTGGRFGEGNVVQDTFNRINNNNWIVGKGIGELKIYDNALILYIIEGGFLALIGFLTITVLLFVFTLYIKEKMYRVYYFQIILLVGISNVGAPVFSLNRVSVFSILFIVLLLFKIKNKEEDTNI